MRETIYQVGKGKSAGKLGERLSKRLKLVGIDSVERMGGSEEVVLLERSSEQDRPDSRAGINLIFLSCIFRLVL